MAEPRAFALLFVAVATAFPVVMTPAVAHAQSSSATQAEDAAEAKRLFGEGSAAFLAKRYAEALVGLRASYKLVPSPNSGLLIARCLRELNRRVEAVAMFQTVATDARRRAEAGDARYSQTADVATSEAATLRATLGTVRVRVVRPSPGSLVIVDGAASPATETDLVLLHTPGEVAVRFKPRAGAEQSQRATLTAGNEVRMEFTAPPESPNSSPQTPPPGEGGGAGVPAITRSEPAAWTLPAALVSTGVAIAGAGVFIGFGLSSESKYDDLEKRCQSTAGCGGTADREAADAGKRDQTIANVGLAVGITGAAAAMTFLLVRAFGPRTNTASSSSRRAFIALTAGGVSGVFE